MIKNISKEKSRYEEGCLSIPNTFIDIERPKICNIEFIDIDGKKRIWSVMAFYQPASNMK